MGWLKNIKAARKAIRFACLVILSFFISGVERRRVISQKAVRPEIKWMIRLTRW